VLKLNRFAYYYVAMFILGSVVRYEPELMLIASARYIATAICHQLPIFGRVPLSDAREKIDRKEFSRGSAFISGDMVVLTYYSEKEPRYTHLEVEKSELGPFIEWMMRRDDN
jgi:hypothetical protein